MWKNYATQKHWREIRPSAPEVATATAPGLDVRLTGCLAKIESWPPDRAALAEFSQLCHANGFLPEAIQGYRALLEVDPAEGRWPHLLASILTGLGRLDESLPLLQRVTEIAPAQRIGWQRLGDTQMKINHLDEAEVAYQEVLKREAGDVYALFGLARCELQSGRLTSARSRLLQATVSNPNFPGAQSLLATVYEQLGNTEAAELARKRVSGDGHYTAAPDPWALDLVAYCHDPYALLTAASAESSDGLPQNALPLLNRALQLAPNDARLHRQLGNTLFRLNDKAGAQRELEIALALAKDDEKIRTDLIKILRDQNNLARVEQVVMEGTVTNPDSAGLHYEAGKIDALAGRPDQAIQHFALVWQLRPQEAAAPCELATLYFITGRGAKGVAVLEAVLKTHPNNRSAISLLVRQGIQSGDPRTSSWFKLLEALTEPPADMAELRRAYQQRFGSAP